VLPFSMTVTPRDSKTYTENKIGRERRRFSPSSGASLHKTFRILAKSGLNTTQALERMAVEVESTSEVEELIAFIAGFQN
jgi:acyl-[acyl carrier protein]--UDP-N-acetylglucosamine O-acyltransferase